MADTNQNFQSMKASILFQGIVMEEDVAVRNLWKKNDAYFIDLYFYRTRRSRIIDAVYIKNLRDSKTGKFYPSVEDFVSDYNQKIEDVAINEAKKNVAKKKKLTNPEDPSILLDALKDDLVILLFVSKCDSALTDVKIKVIRDYISSENLHVRALSRECISDYMHSLNPTEDDYYRAVANIAVHTPEDTVKLLKEVIKMCISDGTFSYKERYYISEILQMLRIHNINIDIGF